MGLTDKHLAYGDDIPQTQTEKDYYWKINRQQPCDDCISRQVVINVINQNCIFENEYNLTASRIKEKVQQLPSITPKEKTGYWIDDEFGSKCSCCDIHTHLDKFDRPMKFKYCSMCGAKMEVSE